MGIELLGRRIADDDCDDPRAQSLVGSADHRHLAHPRVAREHVLDLHRVDVLAARDDHVVDPAVDPEIAVGVEMPGVAGVVPAVADRLGVCVGPVPVAGERLVAREVRADLAVGLELQPCVERRPAGAAGLRPLVGADREGVDLGRPVVVHEHLGRERFDAPHDHGRGHRRSRVAERADARDVALGEPLGAEQVVEQGGDEVERRDPLTLDQLERLLRIPPGLRDVTAAHEVHREQGVDAHRVVERHHAKGAVGVPVAVLQGLAEPAGPVGSVRPGDALRPPRRARGVEEERDLALVAVELPLVRRAVGERIAVADHERRPGILDAVGELLLGQPPRERRAHRACPLARPVEQRRLEPVVEDDRDPRARLDPEPAGDPRHLRQQFP